MVRSGVQAQGYRGTISMVTVYGIPSPNGNLRGRDILSAGARYRE